MKLEAVFNKALIRGRLGAGRRGTAATRGLGGPLGGGHASTALGGTSTVPVQQEGGRGGGEAGA